MDFGIRGKVALVCGGSRGIAFAAADLLAAEGAELVLCARNEAALASAAARLAHHGVPVQTIASDLSTAAGLKSAISATLSQRTHVDILITNTGGPATSTAMGPDWAAWERASELLLRSAVELTRAFVPEMRARHWGRVIGITSFAVKRPVPSLVLSNALRAAVTGYLRTLADEVAADGVTVNTVLPGYTATERLDDLATANSARQGISREAVFDAWRADAPAGRLGEPGEVGAVVAFLASQQAAFLTGQAICVDGGAIRSLL